MVRLVFYAAGLLILLGNAFGKSDCPEAVVRKVKEVDWVRCNEENGRRVEKLKQQSLSRDELVEKMCCSLTVATTCWVDTLRSECDDEAAEELKQSIKFNGDCASWIYAEAVSRCQLWYTTWWFITIIVILAIIVVASLIVWGLRKRAHRKS